jgi:YesN/AraC family two-component response regulator
MKGWLSSKRIFYRYLLTYVLLLPFSFVCSMNLSDIRFERYSAEYLQTLYLCRSSDYRQTTSEIKAAFQSMLDIFEREAENNVLSLVKIRAYIQKNALSSAFSAVTLADTFNTSTAYMSYLYKKLTGQNITEYVL